MLLDVLSQKLSSELAEFPDALIKVVQDDGRFWVEIRQHGHLFTHAKMNVDSLLGAHDPIFDSIVRWAKHELSRFFVSVEIPKQDRINHGDLVYYRRNYPDKPYRVKITKDGVRRVNGTAYPHTEEDAFYNTFRKAKYSPAGEFFKLFLDAECNRIGSFEVKRQLASECVALMIRAHMEFWKEDFSIISRLSYDWESLYKIALEPERGNTINNSAVRALEWRMDRTPFILDGKRLYVGCPFSWKGKQVECTSIQRGRKMVDGKSVECDSHLVACSYEWIKNESTGYREKKKDKIYKIYHKDLVPPSTDESGNS